MKKYRKIEVKEPVTYDELESKTCDVCGTEYFPDEDNRDVHQVKYLWFRDENTGVDYEIDYCSSCIVETFREHFRKIKFIPPDDY